MDGCQRPAVQLFDLQNVPTKPGKSVSAQLQALERCQQWRNYRGTLPGPPGPAPADLPPVLHADLQWTSPRPAAHTPRPLRPLQHQPQQCAGVSQCSGRLLPLSEWRWLLGGVLLCARWWGGAESGQPGRPAAPGRGRLEILQQRLGNRLQPPGHRRGHAGGSGRRAQARARHRVPCGGWACHHPDHYRHLLLPQGEEN